MSISDVDFDFVCKLVRERAAIVLEDGKQYLVESRLMALARREGIASVEQVIADVRSGPVGGGLQRKVIEAMTTNESSFFRDMTPYKALRQTVVPEVMRQRAAERSLQIWSCACSSGQEPYSIAMLLREHFPTLVNWKVRMSATDLSSEMVARARAGLFSQLEVNRGLPAPMLIKYFERRGLDWQVRDDVRRGIDFRELNLAGPWSGVPQSDIVMLRNVLIYFDMDTKRKILGKVRQILRPGGFVFLGTAETTMNLDDKYELLRADGAVYYRVRGA
jgi:chemotaxis protein methyltransferase CheR